MKIKDISIDKLKPYANNPRHNEPAIEPVMASIREFGFQQPIVVTKDMVVVAGHTRLEAAKRLGLDSVPCKIADDLTPEEIKAYRLADNKTAELALWDAEKLADEMADLSDFDMQEFGFGGDVSFADFDGKGDGGGSQVSTGDKVRVVIGALMCDIPDENHELYDLSRELDAAKVPAIIANMLLQGTLK